MNIKASTNDFLLSVNVSASAAVKDGSGFAGAVNILHGGTVGTVELEDSEAGIMSRGGSVAIRGNTNTKAVNVTAGAAGSGTANAIGLSINMNFFDRTSGVDIGGGDKYSIIAKKDILISSKGNDTTGLGALAIAGGNDFVFSGNAAVVVSENDVRTRIGNGLIAAGGEVAINSHLRDLNVTAAGTVAVGLSDASYGATYMMIYKENNVKTDLGKATVRAEGESGALAALVPGLEDGAFSGLYVGATMSQTTVAAAAGVATGKEMGVEGNVLNVNNLNKVKAILSSATVKALRNEGTGAGSATVESGIDASNIIISGGFNASKNMSVGVGIVTLVSDNDVQSLVNNIEAEKDIHVRASNQEKLVQANVQAGFAKEMSVETGISFQLIESDVLAKILGKANAVYGSLHLESHNDITQVNATVTVGMITPVAVLNIYSGSSEASLAGDKAVQAAGAVRVNATSDKQVDLFTVGAAATQNAMSGSLSLSFLKDQTRAIMGKNVQLEAQSLDVQAQSDYGLIGVSGAIAYSNQDTWAVNLMLSFAKSLALAEVEGQAVLKGGEATVQARSHRDVLDIGASASLSGFGSDTSKGTGVTVAGLIAGSRMDQDAADMMVYGKINKDEQNQSNQSEQNQKTFDENKLKSQMDSGLSWTRNKNLSSQLEEQTDEEGNVTRSSLTDDLRGSGKYAHEMEVGSGDSFDATSGIVSDEFYEERQGPTEGDTQLGSKETDPEDDGSYMHDRNENMGYGEHASIDDSENEDIQKARKLGHTVYDEEPSDSVIARIGADAKITAAGVNVQAIQGTEADIVGGTLAYGGLTGVGISAAFAELHSNVSASSMGTLDVQDGNINIQAMSVGGDVEDVAQGSGTKQSDAAFLIGLNDEEDNTYRQEDRDNAVSAGIRGGNEKDEGALGDNPLAMDAEEQEDNTEKEIKVDQQSIRVIGLSAVASKTTAEAVAVSVLRTDNVTQAVAGGTMNNVGAMNVKATADYDDISAITLGIGVNTQDMYGTEYAFAGSVGVVAASGEVNRTAISHVFLTTNLAAVAGGVATMFVTWIKYGKPSLSLTLNGILAGLVGITASPS